MKWKRTDWVLKTLLDGIDRERVKDHHNLCDFFQDREEELRSLALQMRKRDRERRHREMEQREKLMEYERKARHDNVKRSHSRSPKRKRSRWGNTSSALLLSGIVLILHIHSPNALKEEISWKSGKVRYLEPHHATFNAQCCYQVAAWAIMLNR
jgi:hypothetical protein